MLRVVKQWSEAHIEEILSARDDDDACVTA
jgi:hypothetical protein